jgi:hypothetical protein
MLRLVLTDAAGSGKQERHMALSKSNESAGYPWAGVLSHVNGDGRLAHIVYECQVCGALTRSPDLHREQSGHDAPTTDSLSSLNELH